MCTNQPEVERDLVALTKQEQCLLAKAKSLLGGLEVISGLCWGRAEQEHIKRIADFYIAFGKEK